jgi:hypothetical protein
MANVGPTTGKIFRPLGDEKEELVKLVSQLFDTKPGDMTHGHLSSLILSLIYAGDPELLLLVKTKCELTCKVINRAWLKRDPVAANDLREYGALCLGLGLLHGMQFGRNLDKKSKGIVDSILKHAAVKRLLVKEPKVTTLKICCALDKATEPLPKRVAWMELWKKDRCWSRWAAQPLVKMAIRDARKAALQEENYYRLRAALDDVGVSSNPLNFIRIKKYGSVNGRSKAKAK